MGIEVECEIEETTIHDSKRFRGYQDIPGVQATCSRCGHVTEAFGVGEDSRNRCLALMRQECPEDENNFYVDADESMADVVDFSSRRG